MALQGTLDTFELPDVLRLLASTRKSGRLDLRSDRGEGNVWMADGQVVGIAAPTGAGDLGDGLFELLRAREGDFVFQSGAEPTDAVPPADVEPLLATAEAQLAEWREIEAVVPSLSSWVGLAPELPTPSLTVDEDTWRLVAAIGSGLTVAELGDALGLGEVPVSGLVRDLVELGLGAVAPAPAHVRTAAPATPTAPVVEPMAVEPAPVEAAFEPLPEPVVERPYEPIPEPVYETTAYEPFVPMPAPPKAPLFSFEPEPAPEAEADDVGAKLDAALERVDDPTEADEVVRQLAMLSPRAAQAVVAAATSASDADCEAAVEAVEDDDEPVDRGLLLKFLSSVKG